MTLTLQPNPFTNNVYLHPPTSMQTLHTKFYNDYAATTANPTLQPPRPDTRPREP